MYGTFFLALVAAGGGTMTQTFPGTISRTAAVLAPGLMVADTEVERPEQP